MNKSIQQAPQLGVCSLVLAYTACKGKSAADLADRTGVPEDAITV